MSTRKESMSNVDTAWLHMDRPTNLMMITSFMTFDEPLDYDRLAAVLERRLLTFDRFRQKVVEPVTPFGNVTWEEDRAFDLRAHLHRIALPAPGDKAALQEVMSDLISTPLDRSKPLWQFHLIENYGNGCVVAGRLHHCIADGIALMRVLLSMTDLTPDGDLRQAPEDTSAQNGDYRPRGLLNSVASLPSSLTKSAWHMTGSVARQGVETAKRPRRLVDALSFGAKGTLTLGEMALLPPDPANLFKGDLGALKRLAWTDPLPLPEVKRTAKALGATINDLMLTAVSGALRRYLQERNQPVDGLSFRALVPVNLRPMTEELRLGNRFGMVFLPLPVGIADRMDRLASVKKEMDALKASTEPIVVYGVLGLMGMTPQEIEDLFVAFFGSKATSVMTNVPGPQLPLYLAGKQMREIMAWVPQSGRLGLGVSILSYNGTIMVGVNTDENHVPNPERIVTHFYIEYESLKELAAEKLQP